MNPTVKKSTGTSSPDLSNLRTRDSGLTGTHGPVSCCVDAFHGILVSVDAAIGFLNGYSLNSQERSNLSARALGRRLVTPRGNGNDPSLNPRGISTPQAVK